MKKIFITGGHLTPALAMIDELKKRDFGIFYIGRKYALEGESVESEEWRVMGEKKISFLELTTGRLQRRLTSYTVYSILKIPFGIIQASRYVTTYKPDVILSFGGYVALPLAYAGWLQKVPIVTHEQTVIQGLANRFISKISARICTSWPSQNYARGDKCTYTGNPLRKEIFQHKTFPPRKSNKPVIYITGGNLGSHSINVLIKEMLTPLLEDFVVVHQCGRSRVYNDFKSLSDLRSKLPANLQADYYLFEYIGDDLIGTILNAAEIVVSRAGANTIMELMALRKAALLIPLPWSGGAEQQKNAEFLVDRRAALVLKQEDLTSDTLLRTIHTVYRDRQMYKNNMNQLRSLVISDAASRIADVIESVL